MTTLIPAYGRDYTTAKAVKADWASGKDFQICDVHHPDDGRYANNADMPDGRVMIRYAKLTKFVVIKHRRPDVLDPTPN